MVMGVGQEGMRAVGVGLGRKIKSTKLKSPTCRSLRLPRSLRETAGLSTFLFMTILLSFFSLGLMLFSSGRSPRLKSSVDKRGSLGTLAKEPRPNF